MESSHAVAESTLQEDVDLAGGHIAQNRHARKVHQSTAMLKRCELMESTSLLL